VAFGGTEILARLSTGGMGEVLLGRRHGALGFEKLCAVKTIRGDLTSRADFRMMFLDEAKLVARLDHPSIAQVYDFGEEGKTLYLAMEYVPGVPLSQLLKAGRAPFPPPVAARMLSEVLRGLHYAHGVTDVTGQALGVVHRDVSPQNIILTFDGRMKILDFGIAITKDREAPETAVGVLKGKPSYMAPEHLRGGAVDRRADVFSASVVLHELLTGQKLFTRETALATALAVEGDPIPTPSQLVPGLSDILDAIVMKGLARDPDDRYPDAKSMAEALDQVARATDLETIGDFARRELAEETVAHQSWLNEVLDHAEKNGAIPDDEITGRIIPKPEDNIPGPPPEPRPSLSPVPQRISSPPTKAPSRASIAPSSRSSGGPAPSSPIIARKSWTAPAPIDNSVTQIPTAESRRSQRLAMAAVFFVSLFSVLLFASIGSSDAVPPEALPEAAPFVSAAPSPSPSAPMPHLTLPEGDADEIALESTPGSPERVRPRRSSSPDPSRRPKVEEPAPLAGPPGIVVIGADPYANVRIDGTDLGVTPLRKSLPPGPHEIELVSPDSGEIRWKKRVNIAPDETVRIKVP